MIQSFRNYAHAPALFQSAEVQEEIENLLSQGDVGHLRLDILMRDEVLGPLLEAFHGKCAITEERLSLTGSRAFVAHYRPPGMYYWLSYEWSNLLPVSEEFVLYQKEYFPLLERGSRVTYPSQDRSGWRADHPTLLEEKALLLHPELDDPMQFMTYRPDGQIAPRGRSLRAEETITTYKLNHGRAIVARQHTLRRVRRLFAECTREFLQNHPKGFRDAPLLLEYFEKPLGTLVQWAKPEEEFASLGRTALAQFEEFIIPWTATGPKGFRTLSALHRAYLAQQEKDTATAPAAQPVEEKDSFKLLFTGVEFRHIKCFRNVKILFPEENTAKSILLISGTNGIGKSTLLQTIALALSGMAKPPVGYGWTNVVTAGETEGKVVIELLKDDIPICFEFEVGRDDILGCTTHKRFLRQIAEDFLVLGYGSGRNFGHMDVTKNRHFEPIASLFGEDRYLKNLDDERTYTLATDNIDNLTPIINRVLAGASGKHFGQVSFLGIHGDSFVFETPTGRAFLNSMSDGFQTAFTWIFDMLIRMMERQKDIRHPEAIEGLVLIDEIDVHLNPHWQQRFIPDLTALFPRIQFVLSTQSPFTIQSMTDANILKLDLEADGQITAAPFPLSGKPWGWSLNEIALHQVGQVMEISYPLNQLFERYTQALRKQHTEEAQALYRQIAEGLTNESSFREYLETLKESFSLRP